MMISTGYRRSTTFLISWMTAPVSEVTTPILAGNAGKFPLALRSKQAQCCKFLLPLLDQQVLLPEAGLLHLFDLQLVGPVGGIQRDRPGDDNFHALLRGEREPVGIRPPHHALDDRRGAAPAFLREREVAVAPAMVLVVGHLAPDPDVLQPGIVEEFLDDCRELGDEAAGQPLPPCGSSGVLNQSINNY